MYLRKKGIGEDNLHPFKPPVSSDLKMRLNSVSPIFRKKYITLEDQSKEKEFGATVLASYMTPSSIRAIAGPGTGEMLVARFTPGAVL